MNIKDYKFDIIIVAGQSNAEGNGQGFAEEAVKNLDDCYMLYDKNPAYTSPDIPLPNLVMTQPTETVFDQFSEFNGELTSSFIKEYIKNGYLKENRKILVIKTSLGGTGFFKKQWGTGCPLNDRFFRMVNEGLNANKENKIVALLWHQGEHDAYESQVVKYDYERIANEYYNNLKTLFTLIKDTYKEFDFPFICGTFCKDWATREGYLESEQAVVDATNKVLKEMNLPLAVDASDLHSNDQDIKSGDTIHFSRNAIHKLGLRYFDVYQSIIKK